MWDKGEAIKQNPSYLNNGFCSCCLLIIIINRKSQVIQRLVGYLALTAEGAVAKVINLIFC